MAKSTVYLIAQPTISRTKKQPNLNPLLEHGEIQVVLPMSDSPAFTPGKCLDIMEKRMFPKAGKQFEPDTDFLVWAGGDTLAAVMAGMLLAEYNIWHFNWLRYERFRLPNGERIDEGAIYVPVPIDLRDPQFDLQMTGTHDAAN